MAVQEIAQVRCRKCGTLDSGSYCSGCGALLAARGRTWVEYADSFLKLREWAAYARTFGRILASPTQNTLALYAEGDPSRAFQFLQRSAFVYTLLVLSRVFSGGTLVSEVAMPVMLLVSGGLFNLTFFWLARRKSPAGRSGHEFLILTAYCSGFGTLITAVPQWLQVVEPVGGWLLLLVLSVAVYVYVLRVWATFWQLSKRRVFAYLVASTVTCTVVATAATIAVILLVLRPQAV